MPWTATTIVTDRMVLRALHNDDREAIRRLLVDPLVRRYLGGPVSAEALEDFATATLGEQTGAFAAVLPATDDLVGIFSIGSERDEVELSYQLLPEFWGRGLAEEAAHAVLDWARRTHDIDSIIAVTQSANEASLSLARRLGFISVRQFEEFGEQQMLLHMVRPTGSPGS